MKKCGPRNYELLLKFDWRIPENVTWVCEDSKDDEYGFLILLHVFIRNVYGIFALQYCPLRRTGL